MSGNGVAAGEVVVAHVSDLHLGAHDPVAVASLAADVAAVGPALTVVTGDITMRARPEEFRLARQLIDRLPQPLMVVLGNHDVPLVSVERLIAPYARYRRWIDAELDPVVRVCGLTAVGLESMPRWRWKSGRVSRRQCAAMVRAFDAAPATDLRVLALHHPPLATGLERLAGRGALLGALRAARVDLVLAGHLHAPNSRPIEVDGAGGPVEVIAGTATSVRVRGDRRSWSVIRVAPDAVVVQERYQAGRGWRTERVTRWPRAATPGSADQPGGGTL